MKMPDPETQADLDNRPLYAQIAAVFEAQIRNGHMKPGDRMPSQAEMMRTFGVSQATVRQALLNLSNQGLVHAQQGRGVFVAKPRVAVDMSQPGVSVLGGGSVHYDLIGCDLLFAPDRMAEFLETEPGTNITRCRRRLLSADRMIGLETSNIPLDVMQAISREDLNDRDLRQVLATSSKFRAKRTNYQVSAGLITAFDADLLGVAADQVVIQHEEIVRSNTDYPVLMTRTVYLADIASLHGSANVGGDT